MADNRLETRILLRYDTYSRWMSSDLILALGEVALAAFPSTTPGGPPRTVGVKVGDGIHYFDELPWIQAIAADVYNWAKEANPPSAENIPGLAEFIEAHTSGGGSGGGESSAAGGYRIVWNGETKKYILQQLNEETGEWENANSEQINLSDILGRLDAIERWANGGVLNIGNIELPINAIVYDELITYLNYIEVNDIGLEHQFVTSVSQSGGKITVTRSIISASDITAGVLPTQRGGTGLSSVDVDQVLIGSDDGNITTKTFVTEIDPTMRDTFVTAGAIIQYVAEKTAGLINAMHFVGETAVIISPDGTSHVNPQIQGYDFSNAQPGDLVLSNNQEFIWTGTNWRIFGGSFAVKGNIVNADIAENAAIDQTKISNLVDSLDSKVDKEEGKTLISTTDKEKLDNIEDGAQVNILERIILNDTTLTPDSEKAITLNIPILTPEQLEAIDRAEPNVIEHIFVNDEELTPGVIKQLAKSVNIQFIPFTQEEKDKLQEIEAGAQVNSIESIVINGVTYEPENKTVNITIDPAAMLELSKVASTGEITDLQQTNDVELIIDCGTSTSKRHDTPL